MSEDLFIKYCSPTLAGIKTGSLFNCEFADNSEMVHEISRYNRMFVRHGLCLLPMRDLDRKVLLYLFRITDLERDLKNSGAENVLSEQGYSNSDYRVCIGRLRKRILKEGTFPHEIGLFLGYPPEDVRGFMHHEAREAKYTGYWKVYGNVEKARKIFAAYDSCRDIYNVRFKNGESLEKLIV